MSVELREPREQVAEDAVLRQLEELWEASPAGPSALPVPRRGDAAYGVLARVLAWGWPSVLGAVLMLAPAPAPGATYAGWVVGASVALVLGPVVAGLLALNGLRTSALAASAALGGLGIAVGIACRATAHHTGAWWIAETAMFAALAALSIACLALRPRA
jgi:hypothetical protein